ncbi:hypothetical protein [Polaromonas hydrogenivorans]|uniref:Uncharacterized protein n=1 Tax=Polaromonas hydrogenivorans TaxID=335476 RepID=A0AAU7LY65_9BURK
MRFYLFEPQADRHIRKSREYLEEANLKRVEHQVAAEHHKALTAMYAERISRIEAEISAALQASSKSSQPVQAADSESVRPQSDSVVMYPSRASQA